MPKFLESLTSGLRYVLNIHIWKVLWLCHCLEACQALAARALAAAAKRAAAFERELGRLAREGSASTEFAAVRVSDFGGVESESKMRWPSGCYA